MTIPTFELWFGISSSGFFLIGVILLIIMLIIQLLSTGDI